MKFRYFSLGAVVQVQLAYANMDQDMPSVSVLGTSGDTFAVDNSVLNEEASVHNIGNDSDSPSSGGLGDAILMLGDALGTALGGNFGNAGHALNSAVPDHYYQGLRNPAATDGIACGLAGDWHFRTTAVEKAAGARKRRDADEGEDEEEEDDQPPGDLRIVGGQDSGESAWPWQLWLSLFGGPYGSSLCGGTIIAPRYLITAAHCAPKSGITGTALMGARDRLMLEGEMVRVDLITPHPKYNTVQTFAYDFAIGRFKLGDNPMVVEGRRNGGYVRPVCLPHKDTCLKAYDQANNDCWVTGWGLQHELDTGAADVLSEVDLQIMSRRDCKGNDAVNMPGFYKTAYLHDPTMFCAGWPKGGKDACSGDSGGPMVCRVEGKFNFQIYGVVSWGQGCGRSHRPGVYSRVTTIIDWIEETAKTSPPCHLFDNAGNCLDSTGAAPLCIHAPADGATNWFDNTGDTGGAAAADPNAPLPNFPLIPPEALRQWYDTVADGEGFDRYFLKTNQYSYQSNSGSDAGNFMAWQVFGNRYKKRYPATVNSLWEFGAASKTVEKNLREGYQSKCEVAMGRVALATQKKTPCGSSDFAEFTDGLGTRLRRICVSKRPMTFNGVCPIYVNFFSNGDKKTGKPIAFKWRVIKAIKNCGLEDRYAVVSNQWTSDIGTSLYWKNNSKRQTKAKGRRVAIRQIPSNTECGTVVYTPSRENWIECDTNVGQRGHGYNIPRSVNCENHYIGFYDGENGSGGVTKSVICGRSNAQRMVFRTSGNFMSVVMKIGTLNSKENNIKTTVFGGFNLRCRAIRWATWFGANKEQCPEGSAVCTTGSDTRSTTDACEYDTDEECDKATACRRLYEDGTIGDDCVDYIPDSWTG